MYCLTIDAGTSFDVAILTKKEALNHSSILSYYVTPMKQAGVTASFIAFSAEYFDKPAPKVSLIKDYLMDSLLPLLNDYKVHTIYVTDARYFKVLSGIKTKSETSLGYVVPCVLDGYTHMNVIYSGNYRGAFANPSIEGHIALANKTAIAYLTGNYNGLGQGIIHHAKYIYSYDLVALKQALEELHQYPALTCDTEAFSLKHYAAGLGTIAFAWNKHEGMCIDVEHSTGKVSPEAFNLIKEFLTTYKGTLIYHNATFDIKLLVYYFWMEHLIDTEGLLEGLQILTRSFEDTRLLAYLALNTCSTPQGYLSLKTLGHEFAGNYAQSDINDITLIKSKDLMKYNIVDCLTTWFVYDKYLPIVINDDQMGVYNYPFKPMVKNVVQMELTGLPINMERVKEVDAELSNIISRATTAIQESPIIIKYSALRKTEKCAELNASYKVKRVTPDEVTYEFNPGSNVEVARLLYEILGYPIYNHTKAGQPSTKGKDLEAHISRLTVNGGSSDEIELLRNILDVLEAIKIRNTFISKFLEAQQGPDNWHYLFGSFNIGGTISGRLSSSSPNMQNLPAHGTMGKLVKSCVQAPKGWIWYGIDYASLEDRINTILTRDPNKEKIYVAGYDGHSLRTVNYWRDIFANVDISNKDEVNAIAKTKFGDAYRTRSKPITFALTYAGTEHTLVKNCGLLLDEATRITNSYRELHKTSIEWVDGKLQEAAYTGYVTLAFGLRLRTPILRKTVIGSKYTPTQASAEYRSAGNAVSGQSYGLLNSRAGAEFQERVMASPYRTEIRPSAHIHDAQYGLVRDDADVVAWLNKNIVECVQWQELPELKHESIKLTGDLELFYPNWCTPYTLSHNLTADEIINEINSALVA